MNNQIKQYVQSAIMLTITFGYTGFVGYLLVEKIMEFIK